MDPLGYCSKFLDSNRQNAEALWAWSFAYTGCDRAAETARLSQRVHVGMLYTARPKRVPMSVLFGISIYYGPFDFECLGLKV